jgi:hypothetical protein
LNLRPLGYEPREQGTSVDSRGRSWTGVDRVSSRVSGPSTSGDVQCCPRSSLHVLLIFCCHPKGGPPCRPGPTGLGVRGGYPTLAALGRRIWDRWLARALGSALLLSRRDLVTCLRSACAPPAPTARALLAIEGRSHLGQSPKVGLRCPLANSLRMTAGSAPIAWQVCIGQAGRIAASSIN